MEPPLLRRLVLVGAGRAHLRLLRWLSRDLLRGVEVVLVSTEPEYLHRPMSAGFLRGVYRLEEMGVDVARAAERAGARLITSAVDQLLVTERVITVGNERIHFDACSIDLDGPPHDFALPGVEANAVPLRPTSALPAARELIEARLAAPDRRLDCVVVGAATEGVETAFMLQRRLRGTRHGGVVTLVDANGTILHGLEPCRDLAHGALEAAGVCFVLGERVLGVRRDDVVLASGGSLRADLVVWATGSEAAPWIPASGLPYDELGRVLVDDGGRAQSGVPVWAAGACAAPGPGIVATLDADGASLALERGLRTLLGGARPRSSPPRPGTNCLLDSGDGRALYAWRGLRGRSRLAWLAKRRRDLRVVAELRGPA